MNALDTNRINVNSPYKVWAEGFVLHFETESGIRYAVDFDCEDNPVYTAYWLNLTNESYKPSPNDRLIPKTLICIIEEFFRRNPDILLYLCSTDNNQQAQRARLFLHWFSGYEQQQKYGLSPKSPMKPRIIMTGCYKPKKKPPLSRAAASEKAYV